MSVRRRSISLKSKHQFHSAKLISKPHKSKLKRLRNQEKQIDAELDKLTSQLNALREICTEIGAQNSASNCLPENTSVKSLSQELHNQYKRSKRITKENQEILLELQDIS